MAPVGVGGGSHCDDYAGFAFLESWSDWDHPTCFIRSSIDTGAKITA